ncbi:MAG: manganese-dependent inorganic pyrophosphatase [Candidatus Aenigmatarchaeota archaeon]|nr:MAG: manganese-dependent inorganic pyrophosphatase [Candidatus Aenigmarchaeota archaeon]
MGLIALGHKNPDTDSIISPMIVSHYSDSLFGRHAVAKRAGELNNETKFILNYLTDSTIKLPDLLDKIRAEEVILVDTTEQTQLIEGVNENNLFAIIDHHNLGGLKSSKPVYARIEPLGCTCTILYKILKEKNLEITQEVACLLASAIISDTLFLNSPTTTDEDRTILKELNKIAELDLEEYSMEMFKAKSSLEGIETNEIIEKDYKFFEMGKSKVGIGVWETVAPETVNEKKAEILNALKNKKQKDDLDYLFFGVVDIIKENTYLYLVGDEETNLAKEIFKGNLEDNVMFAEHIVSRKKQIVPQLKEKLE